MKKLALLNIGCKMGKTPHPTPHTPHPAPRKNFLPQTLIKSGSSLLNFL
ncbi:MAG: hypothetical protein O9295_21650 [Microcystis sp. LE18-22.4A]|nr:hypothetical protein [Microcystis sp. LE18-22.4A]